jgi:hypothetical protein
MLRSDVRSLGEPVGDRQECIHDPRIELRAGTAFQLLDRHAWFHRFAVRTVAGHGVEGVDDREDPCCERDLLLAEAPRVALPVPALVVETAGDTKTQTSVSRSIRKSGSGLWSTSSR